MVPNGVCAMGYGWVAKFMATMWLSVVIGAVAPTANRQVLNGGGCYASKGPDNECGQLQCIGGRENKAQQPSGGFPKW